MTMRNFVTAFVFGAALLCSGVLAHAEEGAAGGIEEQIKQKLQEILRLMQENEEVLLRASTGAAGDPRKVDIDVPEPPSKGGSAGQGGRGADSKGSRGKSAGSKGEELARKMRELIQGQRQSGGKIPGEMGKLLKMIPSRSGQGGQGQPQDGKGKPESQQEQEARDARKQLEQSGREEGEPKDGERSPQDSADRKPQGGKPEDVNPDGSKRADNVPAWMAALPPEIREAMAGGRAEDVPAKYRHLIRRYHLWLQKNRR